MMFEAVMALTGAALELCDARAEPGDDLLSALIEADFEHQARGSRDLGLLHPARVAGNDTTRHTTSHAMKALSDFPEQRAWLMDDLMAVSTLVEEFVRFSKASLVEVGRAVDITTLSSSAIAWPRSSVSRVAVLRRSSTGEPIGRTPRPRCRDGHQDHPSARRVALGSPRSFIAWLVVWRVVSLPATRAG